MFDILKYNLFFVIWGSFYELYFNFKVALILILARRFVFVLINSI